MTEVGKDGGTSKRNRRSRLLRIRVNEDDVQRWQAAAACKGVHNLSRWLRAAADQASACGDDPVAWRRDLAALLRDLNSGVGNNLNQLARRVARDDPEGLCALTLASMAEDLAGLRHDVRVHLLGGLHVGRRANRRRMPTGGGS